MHEHELREDGMAASATGSVERGGNGHQRYLNDERDQFPAAAPPRVRQASIPITHGALHAGEPCGKCGCTFVNVCCPRIWPIGTIALTCSKCGSIVEYVDGLLLMTIQEVLRDYRSDRAWVTREGIAREPNVGLDLERLPSNYIVAKELVLMGLENGLTVEDIGKEMGIAVESVRQMARDAGAAV